MIDKPYRPNVGAIVFNRAGQVLMGERVGVPDAWQFPQGGIDEGEDPRAAVVRELYEEMGIADAPIAYAHPEWLYYDFPADLPLGKYLRQYRGQKQLWYALYWDGDPETCQLEIHDREFTKVQFMDLANSADTIVSFKKPIYEQLIQIFTPAIANYLATLS